jgi:hypothetical protein
MTTHTSSRRNRSWLPLLLLAAHQAVVASAAPNKWVFLVYMLADNNLEQFGLWDLEVRVHTCGVTSRAHCAVNRPLSCATP